MSELTPEQTFDAQGQEDSTLNGNGPESTGGQQSTQQDVSSNPIYQPYLERFPSSLHGVAEEVFKEWDGQTTKRFQDLHSTYEPYKNLIDEWEPDALSQAIQIAQALESDPESFYRALADNFGFESEQGAGNQEYEQAPPDLGEDDPYAPRFEQNEELLSALAQHVLDQENAKMEATEAAENETLLDETMAALSEQYGEFDEDYVLNSIANGADPEDAVRSFQSLVESWATKQNAPATGAPIVMSAGGGLPSHQVDPATLNSKDTKNLVMEYLKSQNGG